MKSRILSIAFALAAFTAQAQTATAPKPEYVDRPYGWVKAENRMIVLAKEPVQFKAGLKMSYKYENAGSTAKLKQGQPVSFVMSTNMPAMLTAYKLFKLDVKKNSRQVTVSTMGNMKSEGQVEFNTKKLSDDTYELVVAGPLEAGEYVFTNANNSYTFAVE